MITPGKEGGMRYLNVVTAMMLPVTLVACAGSSKSLTDQTKPIVHSYTEDYRAIFDRVSSMAKQCWPATAIHSSQFVESDIYPTLDYGQVSMVFGDVGMNTYVFTAKIAKTDTGSTMTIHSRGGAAPYLVKDASRWATGDLTCS